MRGPLRLATRGSPLALTQAQGVARRLEAAHPGLDVELVVVDTMGDRLTAAPLRDLGGQGIFAKEVQLAVLEGRAEVAVHSAKDLPSTTPEGLVLASIPERVDPADALVGRSLAGLGPGATVATGSPRRQALLRALRPDLNLVELRGNMARRLAMAGSDGVDAVVAAMAALERLGQLDLVAERLDPEIVTPQVGQGALALEVAEGSAVTDLVEALDDPGAAACVAAERAFLVAIGAGCAVPAGAWCTQGPDGLTIRAVMATDDGQLERVRHHGDEPHALGRAVAVELAHLVGQRS